MKKSARLFLFLPIIGLTILLGLIFRRFVLGAVILPAAAVVWILLRIFVLSIDQRVYWWGLVSLPVIVSLGRLFRGSKAVAPHFASGSNPARNRQGYWRDSILHNVRAAPENDSFRRDLMWLFTSLYSSRHQGIANYQIREAFLQCRIPLPGSVFAFLFPHAPEPGRPFLTHPIACLGRVLHARVRRRSGRETADYLASIDEAVSFMEASMESTHDDTMPDVLRD